MVEVTVNGGKELVSVSGLKILYLSTVANGYTYTPNFAKVHAAIFQQTTYGYKDEGELAGAVGLTISGSTITFAVSGTVTAGYLQVWGE
jgi:hypothetical protein